MLLVLQLHFCAYSQWHLRLEIKKTNTLTPALPLARRTFTGRPFLQKTTGKSVPRIHFPQDHAPETGYPVSRVDTTLYNSVDTDKSMRSLKSIITSTAYQQMVALAYH